MTTKSLKESKQIKELIESGKTFGEVAKKFGVSKQTIHQRYRHICDVENGLCGLRMDKTLSQIKYTKIRDMISKTGLSFQSYMLSIGFTESEIRVIRPFLYGNKSLNLPLLIRFLKSTGLTFEEAFEEDFQ